MRSAHVRFGGPRRPPGGGRGVAGPLVGVVAGIAGIAAIAVAPVAAGAAVGQWTSIGPDGGWVLALAVDPSDAAVVYAATNGGGVFRSDNGGASWVAANQGLLDPAAQALAIDPLAPSTVYAASEQAIWKTTDGGGQWSPTALQGELLLTGVACDPNLAGTVYAGGPNTVWVSRDGGLRWHTADSLVADNVQVEVDPVHGLVYALGHERFDAVFRLHVSGDRGRTWRDLSAALPSPPFATAPGQLAVDPKPPGALYFAYPAGSGAAMPAATYQSTDLGRSWQRVGPGGFPLAVGPRHAVYAGNVRSLDFGRTWTATGAPPEAAFSLAAGGSPDTVYAGGETLGVMRSLDGGQSWQITASGLGAAWADAFAIDPTHPARLYAYGAGDPGGLLASGDGGRHWRGAPGIGVCIPPGACGLDSTALQFLTMAVDPLDPATLYLASPDGLMRSPDGGHLLYRVQPQGTGCLIIEGSFALDPFESGTLYATGGLAANCLPATTSFCGAFKSTDGGDTWNCLAVDAGLLAVAPSSRGRLYALGIGAASNQVLYSSADGGATWAVVNPAVPAPNGAYFNLLLVDPTDAARIFAADEAGGIWNTPDAGKSWRQILAAGYFTHLLAIDPVQPQNLYAASSEIGVLHSADGGQSWQALTQGLPQFGFPFNQLTADPRRSGTVYLATGSNGILAYTLP
jgi:photosystem II stability/assembly factor-like uncharacterized protein